MFPLFLFRYSCVLARVASLLFVRRSVAKPFDGPAVDIESCSIRFSSVPRASWPHWLFLFCGVFPNKSRDRPATDIDKSRVCLSSVSSATFPNGFSLVLCWSVLKLLARPVRDITQCRLRFSSVTRVSSSNWFLCWLAPVSASWPIWFLFRLVLAFQTNLQTDRWQTATNVAFVSLALLARPFPTVSV